MHGRSDLIKTLPGSRCPFGVRLRQSGRVALRHAVTVAIHSHARAEVGTQLADEVVVEVLVDLGPAGPSPLALLALCVANGPLVVRRRSGRWRPDDRAGSATTGVRTGPARSGVVLATPVCAAGTPVLSMQRAGE